MNVDDHAELAPEGKRELFNLGTEKSNGCKLVHVDLYNKHDHNMLII